MRTLSTKLLVLPILLLGFLMCCNHHKLQAQELEVMASEAIVTASRIPQENYKSGRSVEIIKRADFLNYPVESVDELLRYVAGVQTNMRAPFGVQNDIGMRGSTYSQVLILIDNVRFNDPLTGHFNSNIPVSMAEIDHIEVIKGPAAVAYGSDAVGGLIHIKTKVYVADNNEERNQEGIADIAFGQNNLVKSDVGLILNKSKWLISGSMMTRIADGEEHVNPNFLLGTSTDSLFNTDFDIRTYSLAIGKFFGDRTKVLVRGGYDYRDFNAKYFYTSSSFDESRETTTNEWGMAAITHKRDRHNLEINLGYKSVDDLFVFNPLFSANDHNTQQYIGQYNHNFLMSDKTTLGFGGQYLRKTIVSTDRGDHDNTSIGIYAEGTHAISDRLQANAGLRIENDENFGTEFLPQVSLSWKKDIWVLRSSYGRSIRAADFTERYVSAQIPMLTAERNIGNPDLLAEVSNSFDIGADVYFENGLQFSATGFYRSSTNLIDFSLTNQADIDNVDNLIEGENYFYADNISESSVHGIELTAKKKWYYNQKVLFDVNLGYTYLKTNAESGNLSRYISNHPSSQLSSIFSFRVYKINVSLASLLQYRNPEEIVFFDAMNEEIARIGEIPASYLTHNFKIGYNTLQNIQLYIEIFNLTDTEYQEILGSVIPGRWWSFGVNYRINNSEF